LISVDGSLTTYENLSLMARLHDIPRKERETRINKTLEFLELEEHSGSLVRTFSGGMIRKLEVGQAMIHNPCALFLDEPTVGLDPIAKASVWDRLRELRDRLGATIFFTTHNMEEAAEVCDRVAILDRGRIEALGTVKELTDKTGQPGATLEDAFIYFTGNSLKETGDFREVRRTRRTQRRLG
jgi:ABC-2 type transport system ATP-binding protein